MQRACFLHQVCSLGSSMTEPLYLLPGCVHSPRVSPHARVLRGRSPVTGAPLAALPMQPAAGQDGAEVPGEPGFHPLHNPGWFLGDDGPQLKDLLSPAAWEALCKQPSPQKGKYLGNTAAISNSSCLGSCGHAGGSSAFLRAGMQDTTQSEARNPLPPCSSSDAPKWEDLCKCTGRTRPVLALPMPAFPEP